MAGSRTRTVQWLPAVFGLVTFLLGLQEYIKLAPSSGWNPTRPTSAVIEPGLWLSLVGTLAIAVGGFTTSVSIARSRGLRREAQAGRPDFSFVPSLLAGIVGLVLVVAALESLQGFAAPAAAVAGIVAAIAVDRTLRRALGARIAAPGSSGRDMAGQDYRGPVGGRGGTDEPPLERVRPFKND